jgi:hypothetical protein
MRRFANISIKVVILLLLVWTIYKQVFKRGEGSDEFNIDDYWVEFQSNLHGENIVWLFIVLALVVVNWGIEAIKWKWLVSVLEKISFWTSFKAILCGVTLAVFTPNRVGEYGGRVFVLEPQDRLKAIAVTLIGSYAQLIATIVMGVIAFQYYMVAILELESYIEYIIGFLSGLVILFVILTYFNINLLYSLIRVFPFLNRIEKYLSMFKSFSIRQLGKILALSFLRYFVYTVQYMLLLKLFGLEFPVLLGGALIALVFFAQTAIPSIALFELGIRGILAVEFLSIISANVFGIISAAFTLWMVNLMLPAILGGILVFRLNFVRSNSES